MIKLVAITLALGLALNAAPLRAAVAGLHGWDTARTEMAKGDWAGAKKAADGVARILVDWNWLRDGQGEFADYRAFLAAHSDWPGLDYLRKRGEASIPQGADPSAVVQYFADAQPTTGNGTIRLIEAFEALGRKGDAEAEAVLAWRTLPLSADAEAQIFTRYSKLIKPHHTARMDAMLWDHEWAAVARMMPRVGTDWQALARAREAVARNQPGVDGAISAVPAALINHPGLAYERFAWRARKDRDAEAIALMEDHSGSAGSLGRPEAWAGRRARLARLLMRDGKGEQAYDLASKHQLSQGDDYVDLEWLSGYIALTYLQDPVLALDHFNRFRLAVGTPISLGRAGYWEGRALEAMGAKTDAEAAYRFGARYQTSFYGLLAAEKLGVQMDAALVPDKAPVDWKSAPFAKSSVLQAALILNSAGDLPQAGRFLRHLAEGLDDTALEQLEAQVETLREPYLSLRLGKLAADRGIVLPQAYYPIHPLARTRLTVAPELALSIARRESEFYAAARSGAGARGLMQLMPGTAKMMAKALQVDYAPGDLTTDPAYNARLGSAYLAKLIEEFGSSPLLVAAGYNAGPGRPRQWIAERGDPRSAGVDPVDWIEHIPFDETRNYVMRVAESLPVYRARLSGKPASIRLSEELKGR